MSEKNLDPNEELTIETWADGTKFWRDSKGMYHRHDGPAIEYANGSKLWYVHGERHRTDGPAVELSNGLKTWWIREKLIVRLVPKTWSR